MYVGIINYFLSNERIFRISHPVNDVEELSEFINDCVTYKIYELDQLKKLPSVTEENLILNEPYVLLKCINQRRISSSYPKIFKGSISFEERFSIFKEFKETKIEKDEWIKLIPFKELELLESYSIF